MNERVMQFRIGMFVLAAGLVLLVMIIWFGESPTILRKQAFLKVHFLDAPGVSKGIPVRRSGIKVGEVFDIEFDRTSADAEGVIVTIAFDDMNAPLNGTIPRISRALIGDVAIEFAPGKKGAKLELAARVSDAQLIEGEVSFDPAKALAALDNVGETLGSIKSLADNMNKLTSTGAPVEDLITTWAKTGKSLGSAGTRIEDLITANEADFRSAITNLRSVGEKLDNTLDDKTTAELKTAIDRISAAGAKLDAGLTSLNPILADLGAPLNTVPSTNIGQTMYRANRIVNDIGLLTKTLNNGKGGLNPNGSIQRLFTSTELYDNFSKAAVTVNDVFQSFKPVISSAKAFVDRVSRDPAALTRGALQR